MFNQMCSDFKFWICLQMLKVLKNDGAFKATPKKPEAQYKDQISPIFRVSLFSVNECQRLGLYSQ